MEKNIKVCEYDNENGFTNKNIPIKKRTKPINSVFDVKERNHECSYSFFPNDCNCRGDEYI